MEEPFIVITGPTATGKTGTAAELARLVGGEVISADSMQIYKFMDIGTAKPTEPETLGVPHHLIGELYPDEPYSAFIFKQMAENRADDIKSRGKLPIICGGTGFYINALMKDTEFEGQTDKSCRDALYKIAETEGPESLHSELAALDPASAAVIHPNNIKRVIRAIEFYKQTGTSLALHNAREKEKPAKWDKVVILTMDRALLNRRIDRRVDDMLAAGLRDEVAGLLAMGYGPGLTSMQGLGYKEMARHVLGEWSLEEAAAAIKTGTRRYAKRQMTWFKGQCSGTWFDAAAYNSHRELAEAIAKEIL